MILMVNFLVSFLLYDKNKNKQIKNPQTKNPKTLTKGSLQKKMNLAYN